MDDVPNIMPVIAACQALRGNTYPSVSTECRGFEHKIKEGIRIPFTNFLPKTDVQRSQDKTNANSLQIQLSQSVKNRIGVLRCTQIN